MPVLHSDLSTKRQTFFRILFEGLEGYICLARLTREKKFEQIFVHWPNEATNLESYIDSWVKDCDIYYCPMLFSEPKRIKENVILTPFVYSDLDDCPPSKLLVRPSITIATSKDRWQALWRINGALPEEVEDICKRIAYRHAEDGADVSGWDLTQLLRVPFTFNVKRETPTDPRQMIKIISANNDVYSKESFAPYPQTPQGEVEEYPFPSKDDLSQLSSDELLLKVKFQLPPYAFTLFHDVPEGTWSEDLWRLQMMLFEAGLSLEETYIVCTDAACNKYARDSKPPKYLWNEICRAYSRFIQLHARIVKPNEAKPLLTDEERKWAAEEITIVEEYIDWAKNLGDAAWQYHEAGAFVILSSLLAGLIRLPTSYGTLLPNLWFMILADTTLTRKTTAMDIAMDIVTDIDSDAVLATDGSIEGLFGSLSMRPGRPSVFLRDEFSGLLEAMTKKDYMAGMAETLTKLYDGKFQKRVLRKEIIEVKEPVLILFTGGIKTRIMSLLTTEHVSSGFMPRFVFISAESDISKLKPLGPPTEATLGRRDYIISRFAHIQAHYKKEQTFSINGKVQVAGPKKWDVSLTPDAWFRYNQFESAMLELGIESLQAAIITPSMDRLSKSGLKVACLIAACRKLEDEVVVEEQDIVKAFYFVEKWREYTLQLINGIGRSTNEREMEKVLHSITKAPGVTRAEVMQSYHLAAREAEMILLTLEQRGMITRNKFGRTEKLFPIKI